MSNEVVINTEEFAFIQELVHRVSSIVIGPDKKYFVEARLAALMQREKMSSIKTLIQGIRTSPINSIHHKVVHAMTTNETLFFRDIHPFDGLRQHIIPKLIQSRGHLRSLNLLFAGCSTGQEPYSVAMLIRENFPELAGWNLRLLAVDISPDALWRARNGIYSQFEINRGLPAAYMIKYFDRVGLDWQAKKELREMVEFQELNITDPLPLMPYMDIIFMRNILIYFSEDTKKRVLKSMRELLKPDSALLLGTAETPIYLDPFLQPITVDKATWYFARPAS